MPFLVGQAVVVLVDIMLRLALYHEPYTREDEDGSNRLHTLEYGETHDNTHGNRYQRLHIIIYTYHGRAQRLLTNHHADVTQEGAEEDDVARFPPGAHRNMGKVDAHHVADGERPYQDRCPEEHPLVDGEERILRQQVLEERQVEGEGKLRRHTEQVAPDVSHLGIASRSTRHDDDDGTCASHQYTECLLPGDRLLQYQEGENHGEDRHRGGHDAGIARRGHVQTDGVRTLVEHEGEESGSSKLEDVFYWNMLFLGE